MNARFTKAPQMHDPEHSFAADVRVRHALSYPYTYPDRSYLFVRGEALALDALQWRDEARVPVVGYGSNRSYETLCRKFATDPDAIIPVLRGRLPGYDVVYGAMLSRLGAVPATLLPNPRCEVEVAVLLLAQGQLAHMHLTESLGTNYGYRELTGVQMNAEMIGTTNVWAYYCLHGALNHQGHPVSLSEVKCHGRTWPAMSQRRVQNFVRERIDPAAGGERFIVDAITCERTRKQRIARLKTDAFHYTP